MLSGVTDLIGSQHTLPSAISPYYQLINPNPTAAFPSLHAAFPTLGWLALRRLYPRGSWLLFAWSLLVFVSVVFLGEHYVVDVIGGVILAAGRLVGDDAAGGPPRRRPPHRPSHPGGDAGRGRDRRCLSASRWAGG